MGDNENGNAREPEVKEVDLLPQTQCLSAVVKKYTEVGIPRRTSIIQPKTSRTKMGLKQFPKLNGINLVTGRCSAQDMLQEDFKKTLTIW